LVNSFSLFTINWGEGVTVMWVFDAFAVLALALALTIGIWELRRLLLTRRIGGENLGISIVITAGKSPAELEQSVKGLMSLNEEGRLAASTEIIIKNALECLETAELAEVLSREISCVRLDHELGFDADR
jgi:hypothetical protein